VFSKSVVVEVVRRDGRREVIVVGGGSEGEPKVNGVVDPGTLWGIRILASLLANVPSGQSYSVSFRDYGGTIRDQFFVRGDRSTEYVGSGCGDRVHAIGLGSSSVPPSRDDYVLLGEFARINTDFSVLEDSGVIVHQVVYTADVARDVCEVGLYLRGCDVDGALITFLVDRTVLSPCVSLNPGDTISVAYRFRM